MKQKSNVIEKSSACNCGGGRSESLGSLNSRLAKVQENSAGIQMAFAELFLCRIDELDEKLVKLGELTARQTEVIENTSNRLLTQLTGIERQLTSHNENLKGLHLYCERLGEKFDYVSCDCIDREIRWPLFLHFIDIYSDLCEMSVDDDDSNIHMIGDKVRVLLENQGVSIVEPEPGSRFDPHQHKPLQFISARLKKMDNTIARTCKPGLACGSRIIQYALVEVNRWDQINQKSRKKRKSK